MDSETEQILTFIISSEGDCVQRDRCLKCPFFADCTGIQILWSKERRVRQAMNLLFDEAFLDDGK